jgi:hypothetical protein
VSFGPRYGVVGAVPLFAAMPVSLLGSRPPVLLSAFSKTKFRAVKENGPIAH